MDHVGRRSSGPGRRLYEHHVRAPDRLRLRPDRRSTRRCSRAATASTTRASSTTSTRRRRPASQDRISWDMAGCPAYGPAGTDRGLQLPARGARRGESRRAARRPHRPGHQASARGRVEPRASSASSVRTGASRPPVSTARTRTSSAACFPDARWTPTSVTSTASPTVDGCDDCSALPATTVTAYRWANRSTSTGQPADHQPGRLPVPRPGRQRARNDERLPQVQGAHVHARQALRRPLAGSDLVRVLESGGHREQHLGRPVRAELASTRRRRARSRTRTAFSRTTGRTRSRRSSATRSRRSRSR